MGATSTIQKYLMYYLFLYGATDTLGSTHYLQEPSMRTDDF